MAIGCLLGVALAILAPVATLTGLLSLVPVIMLPSIGLVFLYRWSGRVPAVLSAFLLLAVSRMYMGSAFMWMSFFMSILPLAVLIRNEKKHFFVQMRLSIAAFGVGVVASVAVFYFSYGANMVERAMQMFPAAVRALPLDAMQSVAESFALTLGREITAESFYKVFDDMIAALIPVYQLNLPGLIFGGALASAVLCVAISSRMLSKQSGGETESYLPLKEWTLPGSATGGLLLITVVSYIMSAMGMENGDTVFYTVFYITRTAFCIQALSSMARKMQLSPLKQSVKNAIIAVLAVLSMLGANMYVAIYGCGSAALGSRGLLRQRMEDKNSNDNNSSSDDE